MRYQITHTTRYHYQQLVGFCHNQAVLKPRNLPGQQLQNFRLDIVPEVSEIREHEDFFGNHITRFLIPKQHNELCVTAHGIIDRQPVSTTPPSTMTLQEMHAILEDSMLQETPEQLEAVPFQLSSPFIPLDDLEILNYTTRFFDDHVSLYESCLALNHQLFTDLEFVPGATTISTPVSQVFAEKKGVCQDFAHLAITCLRSVGLPARYVSGYIETLPPEGEEKLVGTDATHAWVSVYLPEQGWVDLDPTNDLLPSSQHITVAWGRDYGDVVPLKGVVYSSGISQLGVSVDIQRLEDNP